MGWVGGQTQKVHLHKNKDFKAIKCKGKKSQEENPTSDIL